MIPSVCFNAASASEPVLWEAQIATGTDDAEERYAEGLAAILNSTDLEIGYETPPTRRQICGLRFVNVTVPKGATITSAVVQFTAKDPQSGSCGCVIAGVAQDNTATFAAAVGDINDRPRTTATVPWTLAAWAARDDALAAQRTPDISAIIEEIVGRTNWASGNALGIVLDGNLDTDRRTAWSYEGSASGAAKLILYYVA